MILGGNMNKQIQDLFMRSGGSIAMIDGELLTYTDHFDPEKFAKLIVRECADVALKTTVSYKELDAMHRIRDNIKNHFGVE